MTIQKAILRELLRGGQSLICLHNEVETIERA